MNELIKTTFSQFRMVWRQVVAVHLMYVGLSIVVFAPLLGVLGQALLKLSGKPALADMDLLVFALSPAGMLAFSVFAAVAIVISAFELASLMAIGVANANGKPIGVAASLSFSFSRITHIFQFAAWLILRLIIIVVPFIIVSGAVAFFLITDYDINFYLAVQPPAFWAAAIIIGFIGLLMAGVLVHRLSNWSLALPLVLFAGISPSKSFAASNKRTQQSSRIIFRSFVVWIAITLTLGVMVTIVVQLLAGLLVPLFISTVAWLAIVFGLLTALWLTLSTLATALTIGGLALLLVVIAQQLEPQPFVLDMQSRAVRKLKPTVKIKHRLLLGLVVSAAVATFIGYVLLDEIQITDDAQIIAHRGAAGVAPENTLASIRQAIVDGTDWVEIDVQETADGEVVVIHDSDFMKLAGVNLKVWEATAGDLANIDIGGWFAPEFADERVPTLAAVLTEVKGRSKLIVELKYYGHDQQLEQRVIDLIEAADMQNDTMIMSLEYAGIQKVRALRPDWKIGLLSARAVGDLTRLDADFLAVNIAMARPALVKAAHAAGKELYIWTINDALAMSQMMSLGVDGIITDVPALGREVLTARAQLSSAQRLLLHMAPLFGVDPPSLNIESNDADSDEVNINLELGLQQQFQDRISTSDSVLSEFTTDGCSGGLSVGWDYFSQQAGFFRERHGKQPPWENCCVEHDGSYHAGGGAGLTAARSYAAREQADAELRACVLGTGVERGSSLQADYGLSDEQVTLLYETIAESMHMAVRLGGMPCTGLSWRWGYGWPDCS
jgi:glycerophosphoryl diester phosphodiesterase